MLLGLALTLAGCSGGTADLPSTSPPRTTTSAAASRAFCRALERLDARVRIARGYTDANASVARYRRDAVGLDLAYRRMRDEAPPDLDLAPMEYANGTFGQIVSEMPDDLAGPLARARVALILNSYDAAVYAALVSECGPASVSAG